MCCCCSYNSWRCCFTWLLLYFVAATGVVAAAVVGNVVSALTEKNRFYEYYKGRQALHAGFVLPMPVEIFGDCCSFSCYLPRWREPNILLPGFVMVRGGSYLVCIIENYRL